MSYSTPQIMASIMQQGMALSDDQVWVYDQRRELPKDGRTYVVVSLVGVQPYGNNRRYVQGTDALTAKLTQHFQETVSVSVWSRDIAVLGQYPTAVSALVSAYAIKSQEAHGMRIGTIPMSFVDTSYEDGASMIYRVTMTLRVLRAYAETPVSVDYYDQFSYESTTEG